MPKNASSVPATLLLQTLNVDAAYVAEMSDNSAEFTKNLILEEIVMSVRNRALRDDLPIEEVYLDSHDIDDLRASAKRIVSGPLLQLDGEVGDGIRRTLEAVDSAFDRLLSGTLPA